MRVGGRHEGTIKTSREEGEEKRKKGIYEKP
jgi:hypothetical protein